MEVLKEILANKYMIQRFRDLNFDKEVQVKYEINELKVKLLEEEIFIRTLINKHLDRSSYDIDEEEIDLRELAKRKVDEIEELKEDVEWESNAAKMLQDLSYEKNDEIAAIAEIEQKLIQSGILKKSIVPKIYLHLASKEQLKKYLTDIFA